MIIDYDMPGKNGLDFVQSIEDPQLKIIMLTGKAGQDTVIKAFNDRQIHRYVSKGDSNYIQLILQYVKELQMEFFIDASRLMMDSLKTLETQIFSNSAFKNIFKDIIEKNNIVEYYLLDEMGSFFFQDAETKNQLWLIIKNTDEMRYLFELACDDKDSPVYTIQKLRDRQILPYFQTTEERYFPTKLWNFLDCQPLDESNEYYYALVKNNSDFGMDRSKIKSYTEFLAEK